MYARVYGGVGAGVLLAQFYWWSNLETAQGRDGWFWASQEQIQQATALTRDEQETARRKLREGGVLHEKRIGMPARLWFRLDKQKLYSDLLIECGKGPIKNGHKPQSRVGESPEQGCGDAPNKNGRSPQSGSGKGRKHDGGKAAGMNGRSPHPSEESPDASLIHPEESADSDISLTLWEMPDSPLGHAWPNVLAAAAAQLNGPTFDNFIRPLRPVSFDDGIVTLAAPTPFAREYASAKFAAMLRAELAANLPTVADVRFVTPTTPPLTLVDA